MVVYCYGLISVYRFASLFVRPVCSREAILSLPRKPFTTVFSTVSKTWKKRRRCKTFLTGGIGESCFFFLCNYLINACTYRKIFPQAHDDSKAPVEGSARVCIKQKRHTRNESGLGDVD